ncbi:RND family efflux transporter, MFP subunit [Dyella jiangningensis]|uniref:efflux RND transporter periplasmic adaptor subunit n=1 Tax=Dyella sp. AtDHG13 TaxID=1938897 RepID=UPI00087E683F|nr:efflux RND transporter periplasmic adaptor subunit [Dyella sp. AtDHG13]PXV53149.1 RND family efflux transporter MFP subunit [Dyella sp. AtDHG13]SDL45191.1 RND family efflux transporter, MFP subunit [Dyella jiangningensis]
MTTRQPWNAAAIAACLLMTCSLIACSGGEAPDNTAVSAAVTTVPVRQGSVPATVPAYGTAGPAADAAQVMSVQAAGRVLRWNVTAGASVKRGQSLATFALAPASVAAYQQAVTAQRLAEAQRAHAAQLFAQQLATRDQLDQAEKALHDAQSNLDALVQQQGRNPTVEVTAPFDGTAATVDAQQGDNLQPGAPLLTLQRGDGLVVTAGVERDAMGRVQVGAKAELVPIDGGEAMHGTVRRVARALNPHTHQLDVEIVPEGALVGGEGFRADIVVGQWQGWLLPRDAVQGDEEDRHVFQVENGKAKSVPVKVLGEAGDVTVASGALDAKLPLVTEGATQLDDGMAVRAPLEQAKP